MHAIRFVTLGIVLISFSVEAQQIDRARTAFANETIVVRELPNVSVPVQSDTNVGQMLATGTFAALVGVVGGAYAGAKLEEPYCGDDAFFCGWAGGIIGATVGSTILIPLGIHVVSQHSSFAAKLGMSALMLAGAAAIAVPTHGVGALIMPPAQIIAVTWLEDRARGRRNAAPGASDRR